MPNSVIVPYDVKLNSKKYVILDNSYHEFPVRDVVRPLSTPGGEAEFRDNSNPAWAWWGQSNFEGDSNEDWHGDNGYFQGVGISLDDTGKIANARGFTQRVSDAGNPAGYLILTNLALTRQFLIGKTTGQAWYTDDGVTYTGPTYVAGSAKAATSWAFFRGNLVVAMADGTLRTTTDNGATWAAFPTIVPPSSSSAYLLGTYRNKLYISWGSTLKSWDGTTLTNPSGSTTDVVLEGTPSATAAGAGVLFILTQGNPSRMYMMQGDQLSEMAQWPADFLPDDALFTDTLYVVGGGPDISGGQYGQRWRYTQQGLELDYEFPTIHGVGLDYRIRSLGSKSDQLLFSYNKGFGVGEYASALDTFVDPVLGNSLGSRTNTPDAGAAQVIGILNWKGLTTIGVAGKGIYQESGFCDFQLTSSLFGSTSKRINKMWGTGELTFGQFYPGQSITLEYSKDGAATWSLLGTTSYDSLDPTKTKAYFSFPSNFLSPSLQYRVTGYANNNPLEVADVALSFIEVSANPKRMWRFVIELYGSDDERMLFRDDTEFDRSSKTMKTELDALWNQRFDFEDIFGHVYHVMMPAPHTALSFVNRTADNSDPDSVNGVEAQYTVNLVEV